MIYFPYLIKDSDFIIYKFFYFWFFQTIKLLNCLFFQESIVIYISDIKKLEKTRKKNNRKKLSKIDTQLTGNLEKPNITDIKVVTIEHTNTAIK